MNIDEPFNAGSAFDDLEDEGFWEDAPEGVGLHDRAEQALKDGRPAMAGGGYKELCSKCGGSGRWSGGYKSGECFACKGVGHKVFRSSPVARAKGRANAFEARQKRAEKINHDRAVWKAAHPAEYAWLLKRAGGDRPFALAVDLLEKLHQYGSFSEKQDAMISRLAAESAVRDAAWKAQKEEAAKNAPVVDIAKIEEAFAKARAKKIKAPMLLLGDYKFGADRRDPGLIWVNPREGRGNWLARIKDGKLSKSYACKPEQAEEIARLASDPEASAVAYGKAYDHCSCCGKFLENPESVARGIGPVCWGKYFG
jgi:hypothetical protein